MYGWEEVGGFDEEVGGALVGGAASEEVVLVCKYGIAAL